jgi:hypothetical protein
VSVDEMTVDKMTCRLLNFIHFQSEQRSLLAHIILFDQISTLEVACPEDSDDIETVVSKSLYLTWPKFLGNLNDT